MSTDRRRRLPWQVVAAALALGLTGCGDEAPPEDLDLGGDQTSQSPTDSEPTTSPTGPSQGSGPAGVPEVVPAPEIGDKVADDAGAWALELPGSGPARDVGQTIVDYMDVRAQSFQSLEIDLTALSRVAVDEPLAFVQNYTADLKARGVRVAGHVWVEIEPKDVRVRGHQATVTDICVRNSSAEVNGAGIAQEAPPDTYVGTAELFRAGADVWLVRDIRFAEGRC